LIYRNALVNAAFFPNKERLIYNYLLIYRDMATIPANLSNEGDLGVTYHFGSTYPLA